jgi:ferredoxin
MLKELLFKIFVTLLYNTNNKHKLEGFFLSKITVPNVGTFEVEKGKKLVLALEDNGVDILHRCGGKARCTTCQVEVLEGEFGELTEIEQEAFSKKGVTESVRLSCQVRVNGDCTVRPIKTLSSSGLDDAGPRPAE